jgi:hypothetical protein
MRSRRWLTETLIVYPKRPAIWLEPISHSARSDQPFGSKAISHPALYREIA